MARLIRIILTGEYPPQSGGVSDYCRQVAAALANAGESVHVFAPACTGSTPVDAGVEVHRLPGGFHPLSLRTFRMAVEALPGHRRILLQYVPHAFGLKGMNLPFCGWLRNFRPVPLDVMFHEVAFPRVAGQPLRHAVLATVQRLMARILVSQAARLYVSTEAWEPMLRSVGAASPVMCLPIPSNLPTHVNALDAKFLRGRLIPSERGGLIGHFGTFGTEVARLLADSLVPLLTFGPDRVAILVGRGSEAFASRFVAENPGLRAQVRATGELPATDAALHLAACDILLQPYPDGVTTRRTSFMAGLALGVPTISNIGPLTERMWQTAPVPLAGAGSDLAPIANRLLEDPALRQRTGRQGAAFYSSRLGIDITVGGLVAAAVDAHIPLTERLP